MDFNNGMEDFKKRQIRSLIPLKYAFSEDPVRMIRALKYQATTGFKLSWKVSRAIKKNAENIEHCSTSRLTEEVYKILSSGCSDQILKSLKKYDILPYLLPCYSVYSTIPAVSKSLATLDSKIRSQDESVSRDVMLYYLIKPMIISDSVDDMSNDDIFKDIFRQAKVLLSPITPPNYEIEKAVTMIMDDMGYIRRNKKKRQGSKKSAIPRRGATIDSDGARRKKKNQKSNKPQILAVDNQGAKTLAESHDL